METDVMRARIYKPTKNAMQSGKARTKQWVLEYEQETARTVDPLMGWFERLAERGREAARRLYGAAVDAAMITGSAKIDLWRCDRPEKRDPCHLPPARRSPGSRRAGDGTGAPEPELTCPPGPYGRACDPAAWHRTASSPSPDRRPAAAAHTSAHRDTG